MAAAVRACEVADQGPVRDGPAAGLAAGFEPQQVPLLVLHVEPEGQLLPSAGGPHTAGHARREGAVHAPCGVVVGVGRLLAPWQKDAQVAGREVLAAPVDLCAVAHVRQGLRVGLGVLVLQGRQLHSR